ncbi:2OG-Fe(II) oxygenase [Marinicella sp. W31]|uniref:2OG-Fe(II) oxygenase n=1 Tax=Marinicella sp. W31 TaxID=3023713 RepID=UPI003756A8AB
MDGTTLKQRIISNKFTQAVSNGVAEQGYVVIPQLIESTDCSDIKQLYQQAHLFRSKVVMHRHGFGQGEYQYFGDHMPRPLQQLRSWLYQALFPIANQLMRSLNQSHCYPTKYADFLRNCAQEEQVRNTVLMLKYGAGDYNRMHQDQYGPVWFPLQAVVLLDQPGVDFSGGEFILAESEYMKQTKVSVVPFQQGDLMIFAAKEYPVVGVRGMKRCKLKHGVSPVLTGSRHTLGIIFHNAL